MICDAIILQHLKWWTKAFDKSIALLYIDTTHLYRLIFHGLRDKIRKFSNKTLYIVLMGLSNGCRLGNELNIYSALITCEMRCNSFQIKSSVNISDNSNATTFILVYTIFAHGSFIYSKLLTDDREKHTL